jgi:heme-degrading monooxygenase HmoA
MFVVMSRIRVLTGSADALADQYRSRSRLAEAQPGILGIEILRNLERADEFVVYTRWQSKLDFERYRSSPAYRKAHARIGDIPGGIQIDPETRVVEHYEVLS